MHNIKVEESLIYRLLLLQRMLQTSASLVLALRQCQVCTFFKCSKVGNDSYFAVEKYHLAVTCYSFRAKNKQFKHYELSALSTIYFHMPYK